MGLGQPFLLNSSAKVATFWFFPRNVTIYIYLESFCNSNFGWGESSWLRDGVFNTYINCWIGKHRRESKTGNFVSLHELFYLCSSLFNF